MNEIFLLQLGSSNSGFVLLICLDKEAEDCRHSVYVFGREIVLEGVLMVNQLLAVILDFSRNHML